MITLAWKEFREHLSTWLTMVVLTVGLGLGLGRLVAHENVHLGVAVTALTLVGMAAVYGVVCGAMMLAGEHEAGTLVFLDIFHGRRGVLWLGKLLLGLVFVALQAECIALILLALRVEPPAWAITLVGRRPDGAPRLLPPNAWMLILPAVALEAYAWGIFGSALSRRVLSAAAAGALCATPLWLFALGAPPDLFFFFRLAVAAALLGCSYWAFCTQQRDNTTSWMSAVDPAPEADRKQRFLSTWDQLERHRQDETPAFEPGSGEEETSGSLDLSAHALQTASPEDAADAQSPYAVLWWLTLRQARVVIWALLVVSTLFVLVLPANPQILWPLATMLLGVICGTYAFAPEQRDQSYQFLSAQHFPLGGIWAFKVLYWGAVSLAGSTYIAVVHVLRIRALGWPVGDAFSGPLADLMGLPTFMAVWLVYGFLAGLLCIWFSRKILFAMLSSVLAVIGVLGLWMPSVLSGGLASWKLWVTPGVMLAASALLMRAWASGRLQERRPRLALLTFGTLALAFALACFAWRAWELPNVGAPLDVEAYRASLSADGGRNATARLHQAIALFESRQPGWWKQLQGVERLPPGPLELPRADGQALALLHLEFSRQMVEKLLQAASEEQDPERLVQVLALSRSLRCKASAESYWAGLEMQKAALQVLESWTRDDWLDEGQRRYLLQALQQHRKDAPPVVTCLEAECYASGGFIDNANLWLYESPTRAGHKLERWMVGLAAPSLETPWEAERKHRLWQLVWQGYFRMVHTPPWQRPAYPDLDAEKATTGRIVAGWLPADLANGQAAREELAARLEESWLSNERLFPSIAPLLAAATRAQWQVDASELSLALGLYERQKGRVAARLEVLVPALLPELPLDPYSGHRYGYRAAPGERPVLWSTGPDGVDHGGLQQGNRMADRDPHWADGRFDLITEIPPAP